MAAVFNASASNDLSIIPYPLAFVLIRIADVVFFTPSSIAFSLVIGPPTSDLNDEFIIFIFDMLEDKSADSLISSSESEGPVLDLVLLLGPFLMAPSSACTPEILLP